MSFDLMVFPEPGKGSTVDHDLDFNYTSNMLPAIRFATTQPQFWRNDGPMISSQDLVRDVFRIRETWRQRYDLYCTLNPANGWGGLDDLSTKLLRWVGKLDRYTINHPDTEIGFYS